MDAAADDGAALADGGERRGHEAADRGEDQGGVELGRWRRVGVAGPDRTHGAGEVLGRRVAGAGEGEELAALVAGDLGHDVGGGAEAPDAEPTCVAGHAQGAPADQAGAEQRGGLGVAVAVGQGEAVGGVGDGELGIAAVQRVAGEAGRVAQVLVAGAAIGAGAAGVAEPGDADPPADGERGGARAAGQHLAHDLVAGDQRQLGVRQLAVDDVQIGAADRAGLDPHQDLARAGDGVGEPGRAQRLARGVEDHGEHDGTIAGFAAVRLIWRERAAMKPGMAKALMIQGTCSNAGKSLLVAGLARAYTRRGLPVRPFKPQNMSNNAAVTADGGEIGRAQALQARACGIEPLVDMNPVLLKPQSETGAQVVVQGRVLGSCSARDYHALKPQLLPRVLESFGRLRAAADLVLVEGAGSPAEVNLRAGDIANMGFARAADVPVVLAGDIERGGVIAQLVGTVLLLEPEERALLVGYVVNKFRGDPALFDDAHPLIEARTGLRSLGVVTWLERARDLPKEDILGLAELAADGRATDGRPIRVAVPRLPRLANFDDLDPLAAEPDVDLRVLEPGQALAGDTDLVVLPGSKATLGDLAALRAEGWDVDILAHVRRGGWVLGLCGGYQMLGRRIADPLGLEGGAGRGGRAGAARGRDGAGAGQGAGPAGVAGGALGRARARLRDPHGADGGAGAGAADAAATAPLRTGR